MITAIRNWWTRHTTISPDAQALCDMLADSRLVWTCGRDDDWVKFVKNDMTGIHISFMNMSNSWSYADVTIDTKSLSHRFDRKRDQPTVARAADAVWQADFRCSEAAKNAVADVAFDDVVAERTIQPK